MARYDFAIVGAGIAGLAAAAILASSKRRVIVFERDERPGGLMAFQEIAGMRFSSGPPATYGFERGGPLYKLSVELGMPVVPSPGPSTFQVALPGRRITVSSEVSETLEELRREFPAEIDAAARMYRDARSLRERAATGGVTAFLTRRRSAGAFLRPYGFSKELTGFFSVQSRYFFGRSVETLPLTDLLLMAGGSPPLLRNGAQEIADRLRTVIEAAGGALHLSAPWPEVSLRKGRTAFLQAGGETVDARSILLNLPVAGDETTLFLAVRGQAVPVGMASLVLDAAGCDRSQDIVAITTDAQRKGAHDAGSEVSLTATLLPGTVRHESPRDRLFERLRLLMPFVDEFIAASHDRGTRDVPLPPELARQLAAAGADHLMIRPNAAANVYVIPDSASPLTRAATAGQYAARKVA